MNSIGKIASLAVGTLIFCSCAHSIHRNSKYFTTSDTTIRTYNQAFKNKLSIQYLGCGGLLIKQDTTSILVDPFFSNPGFGKLVWGHFTENQKSIRSALQNVHLKNVSAVLITHAHYDHIMDLPFIDGEYLTEKPKILGSTTAFWILKYKGFDTSRIIDVERLKAVATSNKIGKWIYSAKNSTYRIMPLLYAHAPHFKVLGIPFSFYKGNYSKELKVMNRAGSWKIGQTLGYLIDFLEADLKTIRYRLQILSGGAGPPGIGLIPNMSVNDEHPIDIMTICVASHAYVKEYPVRIIKECQPKYIIAAHWEDFFRPYNSKSLKSVRLTNLRRFIKKMKADPATAGKWYMPYPSKTIYFEY